MFLSIIVPIFNAGPYLRECLDSILAQDCRKFELLIRDGGSTDDTLEIISEYKRKHPDIIQFLGSGPATALENFSSLLAASSASLIMFSDHDDIWKPDKVRITMEKYRELEAEYGNGTPIMVFTDSEVVDDELNPISLSMLRYQNINTR